MVRFETDGYVDRPSSSRPISTRRENVGAGDISDMVASLSLEQSTPPQDALYPASKNSKLLIKREGKIVPITSILEIKTWFFHNPIDINEVIPQLWISQTPKLVRAYHRNGVFREPRVEDVSSEIKRWKDANQETLTKLVALIKRILEIVQGNGSHFTITYDKVGDRLLISKADKRKRMLPDDLYARFGKSIENLDPKKKNVSASVNEVGSLQGDS